MGNETFYGDGLKRVQLQTNTCIGKTNFDIIKLSLTQQTSARDPTNYVVIHQSLVLRFIVLG